MQNSNIKFPGQRMESAASVADLPPIQPPPVRAAQPAYPPRAQRNAQPPARNEESATAQRKSAQPPDIPFRWLFQPTGRKQKVAPARRIFLVFFGVILLGFSSYLSTLAMQNYIPAFQQGANLTLGAVVAGLVCTIVFAGAELCIFKMFGYSLWTIGSMAIVYVVDVWINLDGVFGLWQFDDKPFSHGLGTVIAVITAVGAAYLPEKFIGVGWGD